MAAFFSSRAASRLFAVGLIVATLGAGQAAAQTQAPPAAAAQQAAPADSLEALVAPIALYPDDLLALVLPASTQPLQIVQAARLLASRQTDPSAQPLKSWDPSVISLLNYPEVIELLNRDLGWTEQLGNAVINEQAALMEAIQGFRRKVRSAGNLKSDDKQTVVVENEVIVIESTSPEVIHVPSYNSTTIIYPPQPGYPPPYAYSPPYPYYYSPAATFFTGALVGAAIGYAIGWDDNEIHHGDVNVNQNVNVNRSNTRLTAEQRQNMRGNRENTWRADAGAADRARAAQRPGSSGGSSRPAVTPGQPGGGLGQRGGQAAQLPAQGGPRQDGGRAPAAAQQPAQGGPGSGVGNRPSQGGAGAGTANRPTQGSPSTGRLDSQLQTPGSQPRSAFGGAGNGARAQQESMRGNRSMGGGSFGNRPSGPSRAAAPTRSAPRGGGGGGGGGGRGGRR